MVIVEHNGPEERFDEATEGQTIINSQYKCNLCKKWSNVVEYQIYFDQKENKTTYSCPECGTKMTYDQAVDEGMEWVKGLKIMDKHGDLTKPADGSHYVQIDYKENSKEIWLSLWFTIEQLEALTRHMKRYNK